ncbi:MAG: hydroxymethylglutaryl-CoA synthase, partial [Candidatus Poseidoniia archaeon]
MNGIVSYGAYVPGYKIETGEIASVWGADGSAWAKNLNVYSKSVPGPDEDVITIAVEATRQAMKRAKLTGDDIEAIYTGSESHPYAVKPTSTIVAEAIRATPNLTAADFEFACKAGTAAIQTCLGMVGHKQIKNGIAIGVDTSQGAPGDALEYSASAGGG